MSKFRTETDNQYITRTIPPQYVSVMVSGSTTDAGILTYTHWLGVTPKSVQVSYYNAQPHNINVSAVSRTTIDLYVFDKTGVVALEPVTASLLIVTQ